MKPQNAAQAGGRVLIVDDDSYVIKSLVRLLRPHCGWIFEAHSGEQALALLEREQVHVLISDTLVHPMTGIKLFRHVKDAFPHIATIMLTGRSDLAEVRRAAQQNLLDAYSLKPWDNQWLTATIASLLAERQAQRRQDRQTCYAGDSAVALPAQRIMLR